MSDYSYNNERMFSLITKRIMKNAGRVSDDATWIQYIDGNYGNDDGTLTKSEFSYFVKSEFDYTEFDKFDKTIKTTTSGYKEKNVNDIINKFWASMDTNRSITNHVNNTRLYDQNALNSSEVNETTSNFKRHEMIYNAVRDYMNNSDLNFDFSFANIKNAKDIFRNELIEKLTTYMIKENVQLNNLEDFICERIDTAAKTIAADMFAEDYLYTVEATLSSLGYSEAEISSMIKDKPTESNTGCTIQNLINDYKNGFENCYKGGDNLFRNYDSIDEIRENITALLQEYLGLAFIGEDEKDDFIDPLQYGNKDMGRGYIIYTVINGDTGCIKSDTQLSRLIRNNITATSNITDIQVTALKHNLENKIISDLASDPKDNEGNDLPYFNECKELYSNAVKTFLKDFNYSTVTISEYEGYYIGTKGLEDYKNSVALNNLLQKIAEKGALAKESVGAVVNGEAEMEGQWENKDVYELIEDGFDRTEYDDEYSDFEGLGEAVADYIKQQRNSDKFTTIMNEIIGNTTLDYIKNNVSRDTARTQSKVDETVKNVFDVIMKNLTVIFTEKEGGLPDNMSLSELGAFYSTAVNANSAQIKDAAKLYLNEVYNMGDTDIQEAVKKVFSENYKNKIDNELTSGDVNSKMRTLINSIMDIDYFKNRATANWSISNSGYSQIYPGSQGTMNITSCSIKDRNNKAITTGITYFLGDEYGNACNKISNKSGSISLSGNTITTKSEKIPGNVVAYVYAKVKVNDNEFLLKMSKKAIQLNVSPITTTQAVNNVLSWNGQTSNGLYALHAYKDSKGGRHYEANDVLTNLSLKNLYENDYIVRLHISMDDSESLNSAGSNIDKKLTQLGNLIKNALMTTSYFDSSKLELAKNNVVQRYQNGKFASGSLTEDDDGTSSWDLTTNLGYRFITQDANTRHKVIGVRDDDGSDSWAWGVRFKDVVIDIIEEYNRIINQ